MQYFIYRGFIKNIKIIKKILNNYRKFTKLPTPTKSDVDLIHIIDSSLIAASTYCNFDSIKVEKYLPEKCIVSTDEKLLSQVIINLLKMLVRLFRLIRP